MKKDLIYSSDADPLQSNFFVFDVNRCLWVDHYEDENEFNVYTFNLLEPSDLVNPWFNLPDVDQFSGTNYTGAAGNMDFIQLTNDVCHYYGAINFDSTPEKMALERFETYINEIF